MLGVTSFKKVLDYYEIALQYYKKQGHVNVTKKIKYKEKALGEWLYR